MASDIPLTKGTLVKTSPPNPESPADERVEWFLRLLSQQEQRLYAYILAMLPNWADAEEIAQQTWIRLWQQFDQYDPAKDFGAWSRTIAHYLILAHRQKAGRQPNHLGEAFLDTVAERTAEISDELDQRKAYLAHCLQRLSEFHRDVLKRYYSGEDRHKLAADIGRSYQAVRQMAQRVRNSLARCIEELTSKEADR